MTSFIREKGPRLVETGYPVVPLSKGKKHPTTPNWQNSPLTAQACRQRPEGEGVGVLCGYGDTPICAIDVSKGKKHPTTPNWQNSPLTAQACRQRPEGEGVGVLCGYGDTPICAIDVDFRGTDAEAKALFDALCKAYPACAMAVYRVGRAPKFALLFRAEGRWLKQTTLEYVKNGDESTKSQLEVLGKGQQIVLYHTHPETGLPYSYPYALLSGEPTDVPAAELPLVTYEGVQTLCDTFEKFVESNGWAWFRYRKARSIRPRPTGRTHRSPPRLADSGRRVRASACCVDTVTRLCARWPFTVSVGLRSLRCSFAQKGAG